MGVQILDSYSESNWDSDLNVADATIAGQAQSFHGASVVLYSAKFYLTKRGSPTGNIVAKLYAHSGTFGTSSIPTGSALATSDNIDVSTIPTSIALVEFLFTGANQYVMSAGVDYVIAVEYSDGSNGVNDVLVGRDVSSPTHAGNNSRLQSGTWNAFSTSDTIFYVYNQSPPTMGYIKPNKLRPRIFGPGLAK